MDVSQCGGLCVYECVMGPTDLSVPSYHRLGSPCGQGMHQYICPATDGKPRIILPRLERGCFLSAKEDQMECLPVIVRLIAV